MATSLISSGLSNLPVTSYTILIAGWAGNLSVGPVPPNEQGDGAPDVDVRNHGADC
jgi:hypothetical protein